MPTSPAKKTPAKTAAKPAAKPAAKTPATPRKPAAAKSTSKAASQARSAAVDAAPDGAAVVEKANVEVKLKDLIDRVVATTGIKKPQVRSVVEAMLSEMGRALAAGQGLNLPGFGKARVARTAGTPTGTMTIKLRRGPGGGKAEPGEKPDDAAAEPLAEPGEDS
jgi:DNA-binding protein HU-alpha